MKLKIIFLSLLCCSSLYGTTSPDWSALLLNTHEPLPKSHRWATYKQRFGIEQVQVKFPKNPTIKQEESLNYSYSSRKEVLYSLIAPMPPLGGIDSQEAFPMIIATLSQHPNYLLGYKISEKDGLDILDTTCQEYHSDMITKARVIITKRNYYILKTVYPSGEREEHDYFIDSFSVNF